MKEQEALIKYLGQHLTENKRTRIRQVLEHRTRFITVALENIYQPQNASAVLRSCDCFGIQEAHIIENNNKYVLNPGVTQGSEKWVDIIKYNKEANNTKVCLQALKNKGYKIIATTPHEGDVTVNDFALKDKVALFLGTEKDGLTPTVFEQADATLQIPMYGFTESFNLSVSAAILLYTLTEKMRNSSLGWALTRKEKLDITLRWYKSSLNKADQIEQRFYNKHPS